MTTALEAAALALAPGTWSGNIATSGLNKFSDTITTNVPVNVHQTVGDAILTNPPLTVQRSYLEGRGGYVPNPDVGRTGLELDTGLIWGNLLTWDARNKILSGVISCAQQNNTTTDWDNQAWQQVRDGFMRFAWDTVNDVATVQRDAWGDIKQAAAHPFAHNASRTWGNTGNKPLGYAFRARYGTANGGTDYQGPPRLQPDGSYLLGIYQTQIRVLDVGAGVWAEMPEIKYDGIRLTNPQNLKVIDIAPEWGPYGSLLCQQHAVINSVASKRVYRFEFTDPTTWNIADPNTMGAWTTRYDCLDTTGGGVTAREPLGCWHPYEKCFYHTGGGGTGVYSPKMWKVALDGTVTELADCPPEIMTDHLFSSDERFALAALGPSGSSMAPNPSGPGLFFAGRNGYLYYYDSTKETGPGTTSLAWSVVGEMPGLLNSSATPRGSQRAMTFVMPELGVFGVLKQLWPTERFLSPPAGTALYLYKPSTTANRMTTSQTVTIRITRSNPAPGNNVIAAAAATLGAGQWSANLATGNLNKQYPAGSGFAVVETRYNADDSLQWSSKGMVDEANDMLIHCGAAPGGQSDQSVFFRYRMQTDYADCIRDPWGIGTALGWRHCYDMQSSVVVHNYAFRARFGSGIQFRYCNLATVDERTNAGNGGADGWYDGPAGGYDGQSVKAMDYYPNWGPYGSLAFWHSVNKRVRQFRFNDPATWNEASPDSIGQWITTTGTGVIQATGGDTGQIHQLGSYNPYINNGGGGMILTGGAVSTAQSRSLWMLWGATATQPPIITRMADVPDGIWASHALGGSNNERMGLSASTGAGGCFVPDPKSEKYLLFCRNGYLYEYTPSSDTWADLGLLPAPFLATDIPNLGTQSTVAWTVRKYNCIVLIKSGNSTVYAPEGISMHAYRHTL